MVGLKQGRAIPPLRVQQGVLAPWMVLHPVLEVIRLPVDVPEQVWVVVFPRRLCVRGRS
jgi:hypothetical protein